jgi:SAM-dependent methyltransferase
MIDPADLERMRADWNHRAREDAHYYVAFGRRGQDEEGFQATAKLVLQHLEQELRRLEPRPEGWHALEIGCGPGRLLLPLSRHFSAIHGVDVSDEMVRLANQRLAGIPHARAHATSGADLALFADDTFDFAYSYAVFQHIPSAAVVFRYLEELRRVLRIGGILKCQFNGLPRTAARYDTWQGVRLEAAEIAAFAREHDFQLLALDGVETQYLWATMRKQPPGWVRSLARRPEAPLARIWRVTNAYTSEPLVPARGRFACASLSVEGLPPEADLNHLHARIDGLPAPVSFIGPPEVDGLVQVNVPLPAPITPGLRELSLVWLGASISDPVFFRVIPPAPLVPRIMSVSDGVDLVSSTLIRSRTVKLTLEEVSEPQRLEFRLAGQPLPAPDIFCTDPLPPRYEINLTIPATVPPGHYPLEIALVHRRFAPVWLQIAQG